MASGIELATAWVSIVPSSKGMRQEIAKEFSGVEKDADRTGKAAGKKMGGGMSGAVVGIGKKIFAPLAAAAAAVSVASFFSDAIKGASDLEQSVGGVEAVFKGQAGAIKNTAAAAAQSFGLSKNAYQEMATVLGAMLKNQGLKDFTGQTQNLIGVGADLAAQFGGSTKDAVDALAAAMRGESDPIERYGISLNEAAVKAELAAMGAGKLKGAALEQAKAQARINIIMRQSADAQGAFAREADTFAGKQQRMAAAWENFKTTIGSALLPSMSRLLDVFSNTGARLLELWSSIGGGQGVMDRLRSGVDAVKAGFAALANSPVGRWFADLARQIGGAIGPALGEISATVRGQFLPAVTVVGGALLDAGKAFVRFAQAILGSPVGRFLTELLKGAVLGFVIGVKDLFQGLVRVISGYFQAIAGLITGDWGRVWDGLKTVVGGAVQAVWGLLNVGLMGRVLGMFRGFLGATRTIFGGLGSFILGLVEGIAKGFVEFGGTLGRIAGAVIGPAVKAVGAVFGALKGLADNAVGAVVKVFTDLGGKIKTALATGEGAMASFGRIVLSVWGAVVGAITKAWDVIFGRVLGPMRATLVGVLVAAWNAFGSSVQQVWASVTSAVSGAWTRIAGWFGQLRTWLVSTLASAWTGFRSLVSAVWSAVTGFITSAWSSILSRVFTPLRTWVASTLTGMWNTYRSLVAAVWSAIYTAISTSWSRISSVFSTLRTWVASTLTSVFTTFQRTAGTVWSGVRTAVSTAWDGVSRVFGSLKAGVDQVVAKFTSAKKAITDTWSKLSGAISGPINTAKDWINKNFSDKVNYLLGKVGVSLRVPALARGGVWQGPGQVTKAAGGAVLRGYTPGRDPHRFWSPTGGNLALSGGEAVMVPEWTRAVGPRLVKAMNRIARRGGSTRSASSCGAPRRGSRPQRSLGAASTGRSSLTVACSTC